MFEEANYIGKGLQQFVNTAYGAVSVRIMLVFIIGEASRIVSYEFFGFLDSLFGDKYSKAFKRLSSFVGYVINILASIKLAQVFSNGHTPDQAIGWGIVYGSIAILLHVIWVKLELTDFFLSVSKVIKDFIIGKLTIILKWLGKLIGRK